VVDVISLNKSPASDRAKLPTVTVKRTIVVARLAGVWTWRFSQNAFTLKTSCFMLTVSRIQFPKSSRSRTCYFVTSAT